jgi:hypothetical protein
MLTIRNARRVAGVLVTAALLSACAGRPPAPVAVVQPADAALDCSALMAEVQANDAKITALGREEGGKVAQNVAAVTVGLFFWPVLFLADFQGTAGKEVTALQLRQTYLATLANQKGCAGAPGARANVSSWQ